MDIIKSMEHRMTLLEQSNRELEDTDVKNEDAATDLDQRISHELKDIKEQTKAMLNECNTIHKIIFQLGMQLREKVTKPELEKFSESLVEWNVEDFITTKEVQPFFDRYAKQ